LIYGICGAYGLRMPRHARLALVFGLFVVLGPGSAEAQATTRCGSTDPKTKTAVLGTLTLSDASTTSVAYKRSTARQTLLLMFAVEGCTLDPQQRPVPRVEIVPSNGPGGEIPEQALAPIRWRRNGDELTLRLEIDTDELGPGSYDGAVQLTSGYLHPSRTPVAISRSDDRWWLPVGIGAAGGLVGILWALLVAEASDRIHAFGDERKWLLALIGAGLGFGAAAGLGVWQDQDVWVLGDNGRATLLAGIAGSTTGALATLTGLLIKAPPESAKL
jgi:hypothetical protein